MISSNASPPTRSCAPSRRNSVNSNSSRGPVASRAAQLIDDEENIRMSITYLKKAAKNSGNGDRYGAQGRCRHARHHRGWRRAGGARLRDQARRLVRRHRAGCCRNRTPDARYRPNRQGRYRLCRRPGAAFCRRAARVGAGLCDGDFSGPRARPETGPGQYRRLLRTNRPLRSHCFGLYVGRNRACGGSENDRCLLGAVQGTGHSSACPLRHASRRRRYHHVSWRGPGHRGDGIRPVHRT